MKNIKKILSLVIILTIMLTSLGANAEYVYLEPYKYMDDVFIYDVGDFSEKHKPVNEGEDSEENIVTETEHISLLKTFGIWDETEKSVNSIVTMSEFSVIVSKARLGVNNPLKDVYVKNDDQTIVTYKDVLKYFIEGLGYYYRCKEYNYSDEAYLIVAQQIKLTGGNVTVPDINAAITRAELAKIIRRALTIDICEQNYTDGGYSYNVVVGKNLLNSIHGIHDVSGFVNGVHTLSLYGGGEIREGHMEIDRIDIVAPEIDTMEYFGKSVTAYARIDENTGFFNLIFIAPETESPVTEIDYYDVVSISQERIVYLNEEGEEEDISIAYVKNILYNGGKISSVYDMGDWRNNEGKIILSSSKKDEAIDNMIIWQYDYLVVKANSEISNKMTFGYNLEYKGSNHITFNENYTVRTVLDNKEAEWKDIPNGSVIRLARSNDEKYTEIVAYGKSKFTGTVSEVDGDYVIIEDMTYRTSKALQAYIEACQRDTTIQEKDRIEPFVPGLSGSFYVFDNIIVTVNTSQDYLYAYLRGAKLGRSSIDQDCKLRIFTQDNEWCEYTLADKFILDGKSNFTIDDFIPLIVGEEPTYASAFDELIRYRINSDEEIIALDTVIEADEEINDNERIKLDYNHFGIYNSPDYTKGIKYSVGSEGVWFLLPDDRDDEVSYSVASEPIRDSQNNQKVLFYSVDDFFRARVGIAAAAGTTSLAGNRAYFYVTGYSEALIDPAEQTYGYRVKGYEFNTSNGANNVIPNRSALIPQEDFNRLGIKIGSLLDIPVGGENISSGNAKVLVSEMVVPGADDEQHYTGSNGYHLASTCTVTNIDYENGLVMIKTNYNNDKITDHERLISYTRTIAEIDSSTGKVTKISLSDISKDDKVYVYITTGIASYILKVK